MVGLGHMHVGAGWQNTSLARGVPNILKEAMAAEPTLPHLYKGRTAQQIVCYGVLGSYPRRSVLAQEEGIRLSDTTNIQLSQRSPQKVIQVKGIRGRSI